MEASIFCLSPRDKRCAEVERLRAALVEIRDIRYDAPEDIPRIVDAALADRYDQMLGVLLLEVERLRGLLTEWAGEWPRNRGGICLCGWNILEPDSGALDPTDPANHAAGCLWARSRQALGEERG